MNDTTRAAAFSVDSLLKEKNRFQHQYYEFLEVPSMSAGLYVLPAGSEDPQTPHAEDELYYVMHGRARMRVEDDKGTKEVAVKPGSVIYVRAKAVHRFISIEEDLQILVVFSATPSNA